MKKILNIFVITGVVWIFASCSDIRFGDDFLGSAPESSGATLDTMFNSELYADQVLTKAYTYLPTGIPISGDNKMGGNTIESITDLAHSQLEYASDGPRQLYYNGALSSLSTPAGSENYRFGSEGDYHAIRYAWIYIENVNKVPDMSDQLKAERIAEAKMIIAISYAEMLRYVGGVPLLKQSIAPNDVMVFPRATFAETVDYIVQLLDEAAAVLPWSQESLDDGRMTRAGALGLKTRVLCFAASPTFNSDTNWHSGADEYTCYGNYSAERWQRAMQAGAEFMQALTSMQFYQLVQPEEPTHRARRLAYRSGYYDRGNGEVLISHRAAGYSVDAYANHYLQRVYSGPTLNYVNMFGWADGSDFPADFDWENPSQEPFFVYNPKGNNNRIEDMEPTRDPRLYENVVVPGDIYFNGLVAALHANHLQAVIRVPGFMQMKFHLQELNDRTGRPIQWPYLRLPEVLLSYAEAINEFNGAPNTTAYELIGQVRSRVGLANIPLGLTQEQFREALIKERALEFGYEDVRWFDLIRYGRQDDFRKKLYGLNSIGNDATNPTAFTFSTRELPDRYWVSDWDTKWFLAPIPLNEVNKEYGMTQNPGW